MVLHFSPLHFWPWHFPVLQVSGPSFLTLAYWTRIFRSRIFSVTCCDTLVAFWSSSDKPVRWQDISLTRRLADKMTRSQQRRHVHSSGQSAKRLVSELVVSELVCQQNIQLPCSGRWNSICELDHLKWVNLPTLIYTHLISACETRLNTVANPYAKLHTGSSLLAWSWDENW